MVLVAISLFEWGWWEEAFGRLKWIVCEIIVDGGGSVLVHHACDRRPVHADRSPQGPPSSSVTDFKRGVGILRFLANSMRVDLAARTSLIQGTDVTTASLKSAYQLLRHANFTSDLGMVIKPASIAGASLRWL